LLVVHENFNAGWRATLDGNRLAATMVDGWQQAWRVPAGSTGVVHLTYTPQRTVAAGLVLGAVAVLVLVVLAFWRRSAARDLLPALHDGVAGTGLRVVTVVVIMVLLGSAVGVAIAGVILLGDRLLSRRPKWAERTTALALVAVSLAELAAPAGSTHPLADNAGVQGLCLVAVGIVLTRALASRGPSPGPREPLQ
jgi:arabinofuranan 3-O-arabinosyltransferase